MYCILAMLNVKPKKTKNVIVLSDEVRMAVTSNHLVLIKIVNAKTEQVTLTDRR